MHLVVHRHEQVGDHGHGQGTGNQHDAEEYDAGEGCLLWHIENKVDTDKWYRKRHGHRKDW